MVGEFHLGELVNRFQQGSLVVKMTDQDALQVNTVLYGTINGVIGVIASLPQPLFEYLNRLQVRGTRVRRACMLLGGIQGGLFKYLNQLQVRGNCVRRACMLL